MNITTQNNPAKAMATKNIMKKYAVYNHRYTVSLNLMTYVRVKFPHKFKQQMRKLNNYNRTLIHSFFNLIIPLKK